MLPPLTAALLLVVAQPATQPESAPLSGARWLEQAQAAYDELRLDDARIALDRAERDGGNSRAQLVEIYRLRGLVEGSMGQPVAAKRAFSHMLVLQPDASLSDDLSPKIMKAFAAAQASLPGERGILIESAAPAEVLMGQDAQLPIRLNDTLGVVEQMVVRYRVAGGALQEAILTRAQHGVLRIPAPRLPQRNKAYAIEFEAVAQNAFGATLAALPATAPGTTVQVVAELSAEDLPWYQRWWVWASVAGGVAVLATVGVTTAVLLAGGDTSPRDVGVVIE